MIIAEQAQADTPGPRRRDPAPLEVDEAIDLERVVWDPEYRKAVRHLFKPVD
ncbi:hypothetical protein [Pelagibius sp.]|uniref:hypothetical protein n=1 Tax=Pelagibius sp. TaxID=1931238 RepID=UPI003B512BEE